MGRTKDSDAASTVSSISNTDSTKTPEPEEFIEISDIIGGYGPWQRDIFVLLFLASIPSAWHNLQMTFMAPSGVEFWCARPEHLNVSVEEWRNFSAPPAGLGLDNRCYVTPYWRLPENETVHESDLLKCTSWEYNSSFYPSTIIDECARPEHLNVSVEDWRNFSAPPAGLGLDNRCYVTPYWRLPENETVLESDLLKCTSWEYNSSFYPSTIIDEWDLVCDREWLISFSSSIYNIGYLVAVLVFGQLSDSVGRRPTLLFSYVLNICAGFLCAFSPSFELFAILRFFTAVGGAGFYTVSFVILLEMVSPSYRPNVGVGINFGWCLAFISLPAVTWIIRDWFWMQLALTLPKLLFVAVFWLVPESPRWLLIRHDHEGFKRVAMKACKKNGISEDFAMAEVNKLLLKSEDLKTSSATTVVDLFKTPRLRKHTLILFYNWLVNSFIYFGLSYNTGDLSPNPYLSFFLSGAVEFPAYLVCMKVIERAGRRKPLAIAMIVAGAACALAIPIPKDIVILKALFPLVGKFCITATFATAYVYSAEIFPTVVRNVGLGTGSTVARIGSTIAPFVREMGAGTFTSLPDILYATLSVTSGFLIFLLPETNNQPFTDTLNQAENIGRKPKEEKMNYKIKENQNNKEQEAFQKK